MKFKLIKLMAACALMLSALPTLAAETTLKPELRAIVGECAQNPQKLKQTFSTLSADEQVLFLREVNAAIAKMPGSNEVKGAAFYEANRAAVTSVGKSNLQAVLAEVFATVPPEYLTEINERFATEIFSRTANPAHIFTDQEFIELATNTMAVVIERNQGTDDASVRETFAILMLLRASGGTPSDLAQTLVSQLPNAQDRETALNDWIKPAMGDGQEQSYDAMLTSAQAADNEPDHAVVTHLISGSEISNALLADLAAPSDSTTTASDIGGGAFRSPSIPGVATPSSDPSLDQIPRAYVSSETAVGGTSEGSNEGGNPYYTDGRGSTPASEGHPSLYDNQ